MRQTDGPWRSLPISMLLLLSNVARGETNHLGTITWMEVWRIGNVAFRLSDATSASTCNGQFILNVSDPGMKNQYAALLAAKKTGSSVRVLSGACRPAENYGGNYIGVDYLYVTD